MLAAALWYVVALGLLAAVVLDGAAAFGRASLQAAADHAIDGAAGDAVADYQNRVQAAFAQATALLSPSEPFAGAPPSLGGYASALATLPNPLRNTLAPAGADPAFTVAYTVTPTTLTPPACTAGASPAPAPRADAIGWLQCSGMVQESRLSLHVVVQVLVAGGEVVAQRDTFVSLRLFAEPPYSAPVGRADGAADAPDGPDVLVAPPHEGDVGGATVSGVAVPAASAPPAGGTAIHVRYECLDGAGRCANAATPDPDGLQAGTSWSNGNRPQP
ncbi:MAG TPA: hypothetical protein VHT05_07700 [Candidatus Elarobacter sp.]|nr:hypothetical protein [Candidatus Elarobacter sp.]